MPPRAPPGYSMSLVYYLAKKLCVTQGSVIALFYTLLLMSTEIMQYVLRFCVLCNQSMNYQAYSCIFRQSREADLQG